jgi:hypothetical protein
MLTYKGNVQNLAVFNKNYCYSQLLDAELPYLKGTDTALENYCADQTITMGHFHAESTELR